ncbi:recombination protein O N-terminal domain-containing protein [Patescibacteria group bacterium]|nr:recombination protein O N-terminal domain-containing protein [Patescibacteria group bacterium]
MLQREVHTRGIVIARRAAGEGSVRVLLYTEELGLVRAQLTSGREERSQLRPYLLPGTVGIYSLVRGKAEWRVTGAYQCQITMYAAHMSAARESAQRVLELVRRFVHGEERNDALFSALFGFLNELPVLSGEDIEPAEHLAAVRLLAALGYVEEVGLGTMLSDSYQKSLAPAREHRTELIARIHRGFEASGI